MLGAVLAQTVNLTQSRLIWIKLSQLSYYQLRLSYYLSGWSVNTSVKNCIVLTEPLWLGTFPRQMAPGYIRELAKYEPE